MAKTPKKAKKAKKTAKKRTRKLVPRPRRRKPSPKRKRPPRSRPGISIQVAAAKGRPMLTWVGKRPLSQVTAFPAQLVERHDGLNILGITGNDLDTHEQGRKALGGLHAHWNAKCWEGQPCFHSPAVPESGGVLLHGDNLECLATLLAAGYRGKVDLVYIDPPFDSGADYVRKVNLRGARGGAKLDGETYALGEQIQYMDIWANDNYLQFMYERLLVLRGLLRDSGSIYVHCDPRRSHHLRCLMDEVFGPDGLVAEITWKRSTAHSDAKFYGAIHDSILYYRVGDDVTFNRQHVQYDESYVKSHYANQDEDGRRYLLDNMTSPHPRPNLTYVWKGHEPPHFGWRYDKRRMQQLDREGRIHYPPDGGRPRLKRYLDEMPGIPLQDVWDDISPVNSQAAEATGFPTQKPEAFLERLLLVSTDPGDLVLDSFIGSGTTAAVAQRLGRRWIGCDINKGAIQTTVKRLRAILSQQIAQALADRKEKAGKLPGMSEAEASDQPKPCQFGFNVWRVNDYDLQLQHNEAVNIACEHVGVQRTRSDSFFDGTRGSQLVKIVPFDHPLSPVDLEELRRELDARPDETREIMLVCLGIELAARAWIDDWNRLRKGPEAVNRIDVIELRTDPKYGKFLIHAPARAKVKVARRKARIHVEIADFISPTIVERLRQQAGVVAPKIDDWRAMVDSVMIDTAYDGSVFNVVLADIPEKRSDLVEGTYDVPAPGDKQTTVGVKITDMLGEEIVVTRTV